MTWWLLNKEWNVLKLRYKSNNASQSIFVFKKLLSRWFVSVNDLQFDNKLINLELRNDEKNVNYLINDSVQKTWNESIFYFNANSMLQRTKELTIIINVSISSFDVQIISYKKNLQSRASRAMNEIFIIAN